MPAGAKAKPEASASRQPLNAGKKMSYNHGSFQGWTMRRILCIALTVLAGWGMFSGPVAAASNPDGVAVIIGNRAYQGRIPAVDYALRDAEAIQHYVVEVLGFSPDNVITLTDATQAQMTSVFGNRDNAQGRLWQYLDPAGGSDVFVFYSGHGVPGQKDKRGYLLPVDADPDFAEINGYPLDLLYKNLGQLKARSTTVLIDACFSGDSAKGMLIKSASPVFVQAREAEIGPGMTVLTAASGDQLASWDEGAGLGLFTNHFLNAVYGAADGNGDGRVTAAEVKAYLDDTMTRAARRGYRREQTASVRGETGRILSAYPKGRAPERPRLAALAPQSPQSPLSPRTPRFQAGESFRDCPDCPEMVIVPAGTFMMGGKSWEWEGPVHQVVIAKSIAVGKYEVIVCPPAYHSDFIFSQDALHGFGIF